MAPMDHGLHLMTFGCKRVITHLQVFNPIQLKGCSARSAALILPRAPQSHLSTRCRDIRMEPSLCLREHRGVSWLVFLRVCMCAEVCVALFCAGGRARRENSTQQQLEVHIFGRVAGSPPPSSPGELAAGLAGPSAAKQEVGSGRRGGGPGGTPRYLSYLFVLPVDAFCVPRLSSMGIRGHRCPPAHRGCIPPAAPRPPHPTHGAFGSKNPPLLGFFQGVSPCINVFFFLVIFHYRLSVPIFFLPLPFRMSFPGGNQPQISQNMGGKTNQ